MDLEKLKNQGYRVTSRKYGIVSRIDRPDWREWMIAKGYGKDQEGLEDQYRRCYSKDSIELGGAVQVHKIIPTSSWDKVGYVQKD